MKHFLQIAALLLLTSCGTWKNKSVDVESTRITSDVGEMQSINDMIKPYKEVLDKEMNVVLAYNQNLLEKGKPESTLTNWFADLLQSSTDKYFDQKVDFSIQNYGGIRRGSVPAGQITVGLIYELMPFENRLVVLTMTGELLEAMCQRIAKSGGWPVSKELRFKIRNEKALDIQIDGKALDKNSNYRVAMPDYVANGGDRLGLPKDLEREDPGILLREALLEEMSKIDTIGEVVLDGRIQKLK